MPTNRDDFSPKIVDILAKRVSYRCSNPKCRKNTVGSNHLQDKATIVGIAAHITAASPGGPRYNKYLTTEERKNINNGIWLCGSCSILIDKDPFSYPSHLLEEWKTNAEKQSSESLLINRMSEFEEPNSKNLHDRMMNFVYQQLDRFEKALQKLELVHKGLPIRDNEALYFLYENLEYINPTFAKTREDRLNIALNRKTAILNNLNIINDSQDKLLTFIISTDNCLLTLNEILDTSELTLEDQKEFRTIFFKNLGFMFLSVMERIYITVYLTRMHRSDLEIDTNNLSSILTILNKIQYFHIFHHSKKYN